ncbi:MAG: Glutamate-1-semialdehyde aminotransferase [uncultured Chloroflexi bacterium]|uniref:Glutamate-1-semialdehyde aminotransferase n=1 Tax=uncultured Chloroflexota bacterium TaxID=166587 RepID=A0A6J4HC17_9CHLR|nr:MAG: Glutamate-1-semialdehyde aminotransferase [uncultured Chloroflexota bacterium]
MESTGPLTRDLVGRARRVFGGGTLHSWAIPEDATVVIARGQGAYVWDADGREYLDCHLGSGPLLLGHGHPAVTAAVKEQLDRGVSFHFFNPQVIDFADREVAAVPCAEAVRFVSTGSEATFYAMRLARVFTGRSKILKFEGALHGGQDYAAQSTSPHHPRPFPHPVPDSDGIPAGATESVLIAAFNDLDSVRSVIARRGDDLAAIIVEPMQRALLPEAGFLAGVRDLAKECGALLIFDEIITGFRLAWGGAQERYGVEPDLCTLGKAFAGGFPVAAIAGRREIFEVTRPERRGKATFAWLSGTFNGNPVGAAAGLACLEVLSQPGVYDRLQSIGDRLRAELPVAAQEAGLDVEVQAIGDGPVVQVFFGPGPLRTYRDVLATDQNLRKQFGVELVKRGVLTNPGEKLYLSLAHTDADIDRVLDAAQESFRILATAR